MLSQSPFALPLAVAAASVAFAFAFASRAGAAGETVSGPVTFENLSIYFVHGKSADGPVPLTLDEALAKGAVKVHETGTVSELEIENLGNEEVFVHAGDIVKGGQQDRVVTASLVMKGSSGRVPLSVFCVERGRWSARGAEDVKEFASSKEMLPSLKAKRAMRSAYAPAAAAPAHAESQEPVNPSQRMMNRNQDANRLADPGADPQGEVWRSVAGIQAALTDKLGGAVASPESETSLQLSLESKKLTEAQQRYIEALAKAPADADIVGYAFAVDGRISSADIYASNALFKKLWPKLLKAAATEAIGTDKSEPAKPAPAPAAVSDFLSAAEAGTKNEQASIDGQKLEMREADQALDFATRAASGALLHRNVLSRH